MAAESEAPAPRRKAPSQKVKGKNTSLMVKAISQNPKGKGKYTSSVESKSQLEVHPLEGVTKKRRLVLKPVMLAKKAKQNFSSKHFHLDLNIFFNLEFLSNASSYIGLIFVLFCRQVNS